MDPVLSRMALSAARGRCSSKSVGMNSDFVQARVTLAVPDGLYQHQRCCCCLPWMAGGELPAPPPDWAQAWPWFRHPEITGELKQIGLLPDASYVRCWDIDGLVAPSGVSALRGFFLQRGAAGWLSRVLFVPFRFMFTMVCAAVSVTSQARGSSKLVSHLR